MQCADIYRLSANAVMAKQRTELSFNFDSTGEPHSIPQVVMSPRDLRLSIPGGADAVGISSNFHALTTLEPLIENLSPKLIHSVFHSPFIPSTLPPPPQTLFNLIINPLRYPSFLVALQSCCLQDYRELYVSLALICLHHHLTLFDSFPELHLPPHDQPTSSAHLSAPHSDEAMQTRQKRRSGVQSLVLTWVSFPLRR